MSDAAAADQPAKKKFDDKPFEKGGENDCSNGPVKSRGCTDIPCCMVFLAHWGLFCYLVYWAYTNGEPQRLVAPRDYKGNFCGFDRNWGPWMSDHDAYNQKDYPYLMYSMNVSAMLDDIAGRSVCSAPFYTWWSTKRSQELLTNPSSNRYTDDEFAVRCGTLNPPDFNMDTLAEEFWSYFDVSQAAGLLTGSGGKSMLSHITKYFTPVCVRDCGWITNFNKLSQADRVNPSIGGGRVIEYMPPSDAKWGGVMAEFWSDVANLPAAIAPLANVMQFAALPNKECGGDSGDWTDKKYCVPFVGLEFKRIANVCMFALSAEASEGLSVAARGWVDGMMETGVAEGSKETMGNAWGDLQICWPALLIVCLLAIVIGFAFLVLLRFIIGPLIWGSIILVFVLLIWAAAYLYVLSEECKEGDAGAADSASSNSTSQSVGDDKCPNGYKIESADERQYYKYACYALLIFAAIYACIICCIARKIALAIAINKVAAKFVYQTKPVILVPIITIGFMITWLLIWIVVALFVVSAYDNDSAANQSYSYKEAYGVDASCWICYDGEAGLCTATWPTGWVWKDEFNNDACRFDYDASTGSSGWSGDKASDPLCWRCALPRWYMGRRFAFIFFSFLWNNAFISACCTMTIAGAVGFWYFTPNDEKGSRKWVRPGFYNCFRYHLGSIAFGSFILAVVQFIKWWLYWLEKQAEAGKNKLLVQFARSLRCCITCFEKFIKFLNKNAYIQCALLGKNFCKSAWNAFSLIMRNAGLVGLLAGIGFIVYILGVICITVTTGVCGYFILDAMYKDEISSPIIPVLFMFIIGWLVAKLFMGVFSLAVDATLQCFVADEELHKAGGGGGAQFTPEELKPFIHDKNQKHGCCGGKK